MRTTDIMYEKDDYWVKQVQGGFEVYKIGLTYSTRKAVIGHNGVEGLDRAIKMIGLLLQLESGGES